MTNYINQIQKLYYRWENFLFDYCFKVNTAAPKDLHEMQIHSQSIENARRYEPTPIPVLKRILRTCGLDLTNLTFIDLGSGKGLALLLASTFPFKKVIGVEFAQDLYLTSLQNMESFLASKDHVAPMEVNYSDFSTWKQDTQGAVMYFMYNPCDGKIIEEFLRNLPLSKYPQYVLYINPLRGFILEDYQFQKIKTYPHRNSNYIAHIYRR